MNLYTLQQLSTMMDALTARVNTLDGQGLPAGQTGSLPAITKQLNSIKTDLGQLAANFENELSNINLKVAAVQALIANLSAPAV